MATKKRGGVTRHGQKARCRDARVPWRWVARVATAAMVVFSPASVRAADDLIMLARPGPWPAVSGLIGFDGRLWLVNSVRYPNHNSADIYSYDPVDGTTRFEAALFSQDAGDPVVFKGRLYWPFEDPRWSTGRGEYMVTDGRAWRWQVPPDGQVFHIHAMRALDGRLYAATGAWRAGLQVSGDGGATWRVIYDRPTPEGRVTRITALEPFAGALYAGLTDRGGGGVRLLRLNGETITPVTGWPAGRRVGVLAAHGGWLYANNVTAKGSSLWRTDGKVVERVTGLDGAVTRALAAGPGALWAVTGTSGQGRLWRSADGVSWKTVQTFARAMPVDVAVYGGHVYVGTLEAGGRGALWGPPAPAPVEAPATRPLPPAMASDPDMTALLADLDRALGDPESYQGYGRGLREALWPLARHRSVAIGAALSARLTGPFPELTLQMFSKDFVVTAAEMGQWYLLWAVARAGHGRVPPELIATPWRAAVNNAEKYYEPAPAAAWAAARLGQDDDATLAALIARLEAPGDPDWLAGDMIGALTVLTGQRFGHDIAAWRRWWDETRRGE